ncbi:MAG: hypothetical protein RL685_6204 [Pseudomonadota bacterium]|jgi:hypothetical protein
MPYHPVAFRVSAVPRRERIHVAIRLLLLVGLGAIGWSSIYWLAYLLLPALAALLILQKGADRYLIEDAPAITRGLRWLAAAYGYLWLLTDALPSTSTASPVTLEIDASGTPTPVSSLLRLVRTLPALVLLILVSCLAGILWCIAALSILVSQTLPPAIGEFLTATLRYQFRLIAYHLSLVDRYPAFELANLPPTQASSAA